MYNYTHAACLSTAVSLLALAIMPAHAQDDEATLEEIVVKGVKASLEQALEIKRENSSIVDAISADDIGDIPALDLGEALQAIPGVQVNRENDDSNRRQSEISLRGLPGSYTRVTANGQGFASPALSVVPSNGEANSFGSFDGGVFDGVVVYKSQQADLVEGGIAGIVDMQLADALSKPDGQFFVKADAQIEELSDKANPGIALGGTKHFIEDKLAGTFRLAYSAQNFRRDIINIRAYAPIGNRFTDPAFSDDLNAWRSEKGVPADANVLFPADINQYSNLSEGDRTSFVGGLEFAPTDKLKLGMDILYTQRDLSDSSTEFYAFTARPNPSEVTPTADPFLGFTDPESGTETWIIPQYDYNNPNIAQAYRKHALLEEARGVFLDAEYLSGPWTIEAALSVSDAKAERLGAGIQTQALAPVGSGATGTVASGNGDIGNFIHTMDAPRVDLDQPFTLSPTPNDDVFATNTNGERLFYSGNEIWRDRTEDSIDLDVTYDLDFGLIDSFKSGVRYSQNETVANLLFVSMSGMNLENISNDFYKIPEYTTSKNFFNGKAPGFLQSPQWVTLDGPKVQAALFEGGISNPDGLRTNADGVIYRTIGDQETPLGLDNSVDAQLDVTSAYAMANLDGRIGSIPVWGNVGVRYVKSELEGRGFSLIREEYVPETAENNYDNLLPSVNLAFEPIEDLVFRFAYSETLTRPNTAGFTPGRSIDEDAGTNFNRVDIDLPASDLEAYTADSYDLTVEWYNREGSGIAISAFQKDVQSFFDVVPRCPEDGGGLGYGPLTLEDNGGELTCRIDTPYDDGSGDLVNREIRINETVNLDQEITIQGLEIGIQQNLDFLDGFWGGFGGLINASFLDVSGKDNEGMDLSIPRISDTSYNIIGYWEGGGFSARLAYNWRSDYYLQGQTTFTGFEDRQVKERGQLDFSTTYRLLDNKLALTLRGFNLTNELYEEYQSNNEMLPRLTAYDGRTYSLSAVYRF